MALDICIFFLQEVLITVDAAMAINIFSGLPVMRNMGLAKQPHRPSNPVLPYLNSASISAIVFEPSRKSGKRETKSASPAPPRSAQV